MATFNAGSIEASLTLDRSSWNTDLKEIQAQIEELEQKTITISVDADTDNFFVQTNNVELFADDLDQKSVSIVIDADAEKFHQAAAQVEVVTDVMKEQTINIGVDMDGTAEALAEMAELEVAADIVDNKTINIDVDYDKNAFERLVGSGGGGASGGGGGGYLGFFQILIYAIIALAPILSVAIGAAAFAVVAFTAALVAALGPALLLAGAIIYLIKQFKKLDPKQYTPGMREFADQLKTLRDTLQELVHSDVGEVIFKALATDIGAATQILRSFIPLMMPLALLFRDVSNELFRFTQSPAYDRWIQFFSGFGMEMLRDFLSILGNLIRFLMNLFIAIAPFAQEMMQGLTNAVRDLADYSENLSQKKGFQEWVNNALYYGPQLLDFIGELIELFIKIGDALRPLAEPSIQLFTAIADAIERIPTENLTQIILAGLALFALFKMVLPIASTLVEVFGGLSTGLEAFAIAVGIGVGPLLLIIAAIAALVAIGIYLWNTNDTFRSALIDTWKMIRDTVTPIVEDFVQLFQDNWPKILATVQDVWGNIQGIVVDVAIILHQIILALTVSITFIWQHFGTQLLQITKGVFQVLGGIIRGFFQVVRGIFDLIRDVVTGNWSNIGHDLATIARGFVTAISGIVRGLINILGGIFNIIGRVAHAIWSSTWAGIKNVLSSALGWIVDQVHRIPGFFSSIPGAIGRALSGIYGAITSPFREALNTVVGWWNSLSLSVDIPNKIPGLPDSFTVSTPNVGGFATGGYVDEPTLAMVGEGREPEFVTPESKMEALVRRVMGERAGHGELAAAIAEALRPYMRTVLTPEMLERILERAGVHMDVHADNDDRSVTALARALGFQLRVLGYGGAAS